MIENRRRALSRRVPVQQARPTVELVSRRIRAGWLPVALVHMGVVHRLDIPHWVVVAEAGAEAVTFNDPYPPKGRQGPRLPLHPKSPQISPQMTPNHPKPPQNTAVGAS